jgi:hypothetical protein
VEVHYEGTLIDGKVFDSSLQAQGNHRVPAQPRHRRLDGRRAAHAGRREVPLLHPLQARLRPRGAGRDIGPNEALIFDVELIKVK